MLLYPHMCSGEILDLVLSYRFRRKTLWTRELINKCAKFHETLQVFRYQYVDDPYFQVICCNYSGLTERSRKVQFWAFITWRIKFWYETALEPVPVANANYLKISRQYKNSAYGQQSLTISHIVLTDSISSVLWF